MIKAIETRYAGCHFRSRLEARWAVFFDALGIEWEHEPEGFETSAGRYLPDFRIRQNPACSCREDADRPNVVVRFEVKPNGARIEPRHRAMSAGLNHADEEFVLACGLPRDARSWDKHLTVVGTGETWTGTAALDKVLDTPEPPTFGAQFREDIRQGIFGPDTAWSLDYMGGLPHLAGDVSEQAVNAALTAARSERFGT